MPFVPVATAAKTVVDITDIYRSSTPPASPTLGMLWLDISFSPAILRRCISTTATELLDRWEIITPDYKDIVETLTAIDDQLSSEAQSYTSKDKTYILSQWRTVEAAYQNLVIRVANSSFKTIELEGTETLVSVLAVLSGYRNTLVSNLDSLDILTSAGEEDAAGLLITSSYLNNPYSTSMANMWIQIEKIQKMFADLPARVLKVAGSAIVLDESKLLTVDGSILVSGSVNADKINVKGLNVTNQDNLVTLSISDTGTIVMRGTIYATSGEFTGTVNATGGTFSGAIYANGGIFSSNIVVNGYLDTGASGLSGVITDTTRFWAGSTYANRDTANFRVNSSGYLYAANADITGEINATGGTFTQTISLQGSISAGSGSELAGISGTGSSGTDVRFWAGDTYANRGSAKFRILQSGDLYAENGYFGGTIQSAGALNGALAAGNIYIKNNNNWTSQTDMTAGDGWSFVVFQDTGTNPNYNAYAYNMIESGIYQQNYNTTFISRAASSLDISTVADMYAQINSSAKAMIAKTFYSFDNTGNTVGKLEGGSMRFYSETAPTLVSSVSSANEKLRISASSTGSVILANKIFFLGTGSTYENDPASFSNPIIGIGTKDPRIDRSMTVAGGFSILDDLDFYNISVDYASVSGAVGPTTTAKLTMKKTSNGITIDFSI